MKKLFVSLLAIAGMVACTNDEVVSVQQGNPIAFDTFVENTTRVGYDSNNLPEGFNVWAFIETENGNRSTILDAEDVTRQVDQYVYGNTQYWVPGNTYYFAALAPMDSQNVANLVLATGDAAKKGLGTFDFNNDNGTEDLIYAVNMVEASETTSKVTFTFKHLLSKVKFSFTNTFDNVNYSIEVRDIAMTVPMSGNVNLAADKVEWTLGTTSLGLDFDETGIIAKDGSANSAERLTIPAGEGQVYGVTFKVDLYVGNGTDKVLAKTYEKSSTISGIEFEAGKAYNFAANINAESLALNEVIFDASVGGWDNAATVQLIDTAAELRDAFDNENVNHIILDGNIDLDDLLSTLSTRAGENAGLVINADRTLTLDLNGCTISQSKAQTGAYAMIDNKGTLIIEDNSSLKEGKIVYGDTGNGGNYVSNTISNSGVLTINSGTIENNSSATVASNGYPHPIDNSGVLTINGGTFTNSANYSSMRIWTSNSDAEKCAVEINGGTFNGCIDFQAHNNNYPTIPHYGTLTVNGGTFNPDTFTKSSIRVLRFGVNAEDMKATIKGGEFYGKVWVRNYGTFENTPKVFTIKGGSFSSLSPIVYLADNCTYTLNSDIENAEPVKFTGNGTLDLNGHNVSAVDATEAGYGLITNTGTLTITGTGTMSLTATVNNGWSRYSSVISNQVGGNLTVNAGVTIEHLGGTDMAYGIDNLTNGKGTSAIVTINGATVKSTYRPIRQFLNGVEATNELYVNEGSTVESTGGNKAIWMQDPSKNANTGKLVVAEDAFVHSVYLDVTPGSTEWPVEVSVAASSLTDTSDNKGIYTDGIPAGYEVVNENGVWTVVYTCAAKIGNVEYNTLQAAIEAVQNGETIVLQRDLNITTPAYGQNALNHAKAVNFTLDLNGKTITADTGNSVFRYNISQTDATSDITVTFKNGTITSGDKTWCTVMAAGTSDDVKAIFNLENLTINASKAGDLAIKAWDYAVINATNVTVNATKCAGGFYAVGGEIVLDNCTVNQKGLWTAPYLSMAVAVSNGGKATVKSGNYTTEPTAASEGYNQGTSHGSWCAGVMNSGGELIINGGTFANDNFGDNSLATAARGLIFGDTASKIVINDGTFNALKTVIDYQNNLGVQPNPNIVINGGNFSANPAVVTSYGGVVLAEGKVAAQGADGRWTLVDGVMDEAGLKAAFEKGGNIVLGADITVSEAATLAAGKTAVLDLNGFTIYGAEESTVKHIYAIKNYGSMTIKDTKGNGSIDSRGIYNYGTMTLNSGKISAIDGNGGYAVNNQSGSTFVMNGGWIAADYEDGDAPTSGNYDATALNIPSNATATLNGGKITNAGNFTFAVASAGTLNIPAESTLTVDGRHGTFSINGGETTINAGTYSIPTNTENTDNVVYVYGSGKLVINGGTFIADNDTANGGCCVYDANGGVTINGGVFGKSSGGDVWGTTGTVIKGGKFENLTETSHIDDRYKLNENGEVVAK